jgi:hypothetical protein
LITTFLAEFNKIDVKTGVQLTSKSVEKPNLSIPYSSFERRHKFIARYKERKVFTKFFSDTPIAFDSKHAVIF